MITGSPKSLNYNWQSVLYSMSILLPSWSSASESLPDVAQRSLALHHEGFLEGFTQRPSQWLKYFLYKPRPYGMRHMLMMEIAWAVPQLR